MQLSNAREAGEPLVQLGPVSTGRFVGFVGGQVAFGLRSETFCGSALQGASGQTAECMLQICEPIERDTYVSIKLGNTGAITKRYGNAGSQIAGRKEIRFTPVNVPYFEPLSGMRLRTPHSIFSNSGNVELDRQLSRTGRSNDSLGREGAR